MKILFVSYTFAPNIGGIESMSALLADGFAAAGHNVQLVTYTPGPPAAPGAVPIHRRPGATALWRLFRWCDLVVHSNITLRAVWPLLFVRRPWIVIHHTWILFPDQPVRRSMLLKLALLPAARSICVSQALARQLPVSAVVIPNACDARHFRAAAPGPRSLDLIFVGRLVPDKGVDLLLRALHRLHRRGSTPSLTIVGAGPEETSLRALAAELGLARVTFAGALPAAAVADAFRAHRVAVIPSRWQEPFGVVVLEALACGCRVVAAATGGLPEAVGACGVTFPNGDIGALAAALSAALADSPPIAPATIRRHLDRHRPERIVRDYLHVFARTLAPAPALLP
ncbi:glycosyltransferase family 4 protein [Horticoccus luteus]|uniref:Glycosyltransferase family 4 protein n=1 Tax=Horticoccus luteus TaxID=2862869 RepID=A0A8F9TWD7_9BACT|nr:glycosyltransferase family 4 protein [Horticoccus luteus]QYM80341.1 glycosyltransferase family 4 protein [Horticoccus luteus]